MTHPSQSPVSIVGVACALPSGAYSTENLDYETLWDFLMQKGEAYEEVPKDRFNIDEWYGQNLGQISTRKGAFLKNSTSFDHLEFGISLRDAMAMSPSARRLIELSFLALLDSGINYRGRRIGCFMSGTNPGLLDKDQYDEQGSFAAAPTMIANRVSYTLDVTGPSVSLDTACSSTMTATHLAIQSIIAGDCEAALVGGCQYNHCLQDWVQDSAAGVLAPDGKCKPFDAGGNGFSRGEGAVVIVLKPYERAVHDGDRIYATIIGSAINSTGGTAAPSVPVGESQKECVRLAYERAGRNPVDVDYVELHATGTAVGDPIEANAAGELFHRSSAIPVGSIKGNLGHLEITAFLASVIKVCLAFEHMTVPPQANLSIFNPSIKWKEYGLQPIVQPYRLTRRDGVPIFLASISSSGIGGANGHAVLESSLALSPACSASPSTTQGRPLLIMAGGLTQRSAVEVTHSILTELAAGITDPRELSRVSIRRTRQLLWRSFTVYEQGKPLTFPDPATIPRASPPIVFLLSGQGPQHFDMGRELYNCDASFRRSIEEMDGIYRSIVGSSLIDSTGLFRHVESPTQVLSEIWPIDITLPALAMFQMALIDMLSNHGVMPDIVVGHSAGETAVIYASKANSKAMALALAIARGRAMSVLEREGGTMASLNCTLATVEKLISELGIRAGELDIACHNGPESVTLSGKKDSLEKLLQVANDRGIWARQLRTNVPVHSTIMDCCEHEYRKAVELVFGMYGGPCSPNVETYSTVLGRKFDGPFCPEYFWQNARRPVLFTEAIAYLNHSHPTAVFAEISPHPVLSSYVEDVCGPEREVTCFARRNGKGKAHSEMHAFLESLGRLCLRGYNGIDVKTYSRNSAQRGCRAIYPFAPRHVPFHAETSLFYSRHRHRLGPLNFPGFHVNSSTHPDLTEHVIQGEPIMPATGFLEMAFEFGAHQLRDVVFHSALSLSNPRPVEVVVSRNGIEWAVHSRLPQAHLGEECTDRLHASGLLSVECVAASQVQLSGIKERCSPIDVAALRGKLETFASFGPLYSRINEVYLGQDEVLAIVRAYDQSLNTAPPYCLDPAILDSCLQGAYMLLTPQELALRYYLPARVGYVLMQETPRRDRPLFVASHIKMISWGPDSVILDVTVYDSTGRELCLMKSFVLDGHRKTPPRASTKRFESVWQPLAIPSMSWPAEYELSIVNDPSLRSLYITLDQLAKAVIVETLKRNASVGHDISRQRYFDFMKRAAMIPQPIYPLLGDQSLRRRWPVHYELTERVTSVHEQVLLSTSVIVEVLFKDSFMEEFYGPQGDMATMCKQLSVIFRSVMGHAVACGKRAIRVLEIGTGTGMLTSYLEPLLEEFPAISVEYVATDISLPLVTGTLVRLGYHQLLSQAYDLSKDPSSQGFACETFDIITGLNVLHAVPELVPCLQSLHSLLVPGGSLLFVDFDGAKWPSSPGALWYDFVFGCFKEWYSFSDLELRSHCTLPLERWRNVLLDNGFVAVSICRDNDEGLLGVVHAQKEDDKVEMPLLSKLANLVVPVFIRYQVGGEIEIQQRLGSLSMNDTRPLWLLAAGGDGDALLGFGRSLRHEFPGRTIKIALFTARLPGEECAAEILVPLSTHIESEFYFDENRKVHVMRIVPATAPLSCHMKSLDLNSFSSSHDNRITQIMTPALLPGQVTVSVEIWSTSSSDLRAFAGKVVRKSDDVLLGDELVIGLTVGQPASLLTSCQACLARIPSSTKPQCIVPLVIPAAVAVVVNDICRPTRRQPERTRRALLLGSESFHYRTVVRVLSQLGWTVAHHDVIPASTSEHSPHRFDVIVCSKEKSDAVRFSLGSLSNARLFCWDDEFGGLPAYLQHPNLGEDLELVLQQLECEPSYTRSHEDSLPHDCLVSDGPGECRLFHSDKSYLLVGGIGGLGMQIAAWMYKKGARHITLTSRSGEASLHRLKSPYLLRLLKYMRNLPDFYISLDACDSTSRSAMATLCSRIVPPIGGCMVMPLVLSDNSFMLQTKDDFRSVYESKVRSFETVTGVLNAGKLDFIIAFSSVAGLFGNGGQTNYAAACTAMDGLTANLSNAFTLIVPPIMDVGYFARQVEGNNQALSRLLNFGITCEDLCAHIEDGILRLLDGPFTYQIPELNWSAVEKFTGQLPAFRHLVTPLRTVRRNNPGASEEITVSDLVCNELQMLREDLASDVPLTRYGLDSLSAARLSSALRPFGQITQLQLLSDITVDGIKRKLNKEEKADAAALETTATQEATTSPIVRLREDGSTPLIMVHGADGSIVPIRILAEKFKGSLWAIQLTDRVPMTALEDMSVFYFEHIKLLQPTGPYRLGTFSGSTAVGVHLCKQFEQNGDQVLQLSFVDYFPTIPLGPEFDIRNALQSDGKIEPSLAFSVLDRMTYMLERDGELDQIRRTLGRDLAKHIRGQPSSSLAEAFASTVHSFTELEVRFIIKTGQGSEGDFETERYMHWLGGIQAPVSVFFARQGITRNLPVKWLEDGGVLDVHVVYPAAKRYWLPMGHAECLATDEAAELLQREWVDGK